MLGVEKRTTGRAVFCEHDSLVDFSGAARSGHVAGPDKLKRFLYNVIKIMLFSFSLEQYLKERKKQNTI